MYSSNHHTSFLVDEQRYKVFKTTKNCSESFFLFPFLVKYNNPRAETIEPVLQMDWCSGLGQIK